MFITAQIFGLFGVISNVVTMQLKTKQKILIGFSVSGLCFIINYLLLGRYTAAIVCIIATIQTIINYWYEKKKKGLPKGLIWLYFMISLICGIATYQTPIDVLAIFAGVTYTLSIIQKKEKNIRIVRLSNAMCWLIYDIVVKSYATSVGDILTTTSTIIAIIRYDVLNKNKIKEGEEK